MSLVLKRQIPVFLTGLIGTIMLAEYYFPSVEARVIATGIQRWAVIIAAFGLFISTFQLIRYHSKKIANRERGQWYISLWMLGIMLFMVGIGVVYSVRHPAYVWLFTNIYYTLSASTNSLLGFFIVSAAFRAFKVRSVESTVLLVSALIVALTNVPIGAYIWVGIPAIGTWLSMEVNNAAFRGILIGAGAGVVILGIRLLIGRGGGILSGR